MLDLDLEHVGYSFAKHPSKQPPRPTVYLCTLTLHKGIILFIIGQTLPQPVPVCATGQYAS